MIPKKVLEIVDETLKYMSSNDKPFGNKLIINKLIWKNIFI